jgi:hypothetical protein
MIDLFFQKTPLWLFFPITIILVLLSVTVGHWLGSRVRGREADETERPAGTIVGSNFALLAFLLAFTFNMTASRFDARKELLLEEVSAIGTTFLRADFLPEPERSVSQELLAEYVDIRAEDVMHLDRLAQAIARSEAIHDQLWSQVTDLVIPDRDPALVRLYIRSLNDVIDFHSKRVTVGMTYQIPGIVWLTLYLMTTLATTAMGYQFGLAEGRSRTMVIVLTLSFSVVIMLIADLDRSGEGLLLLNQSPMVELQQIIRKKQGL